MKKRKRVSKKTTGWQVGRSGVRFTVRKGRKTLRGKDGQPRTFRTRDAAARVARELKRK